MPWKDRYTTSDERTLDRLEWPDGAPCALVITVDLSPACGPDGIRPKELAAEDTEYGMHVGIGRLLDAFDRCRVTATFATPAIIAETWPERLREIVTRGHEIAAHGERREDPSRLARADEQQLIARTTDALAKLAGARPQGWYSLPGPGDRYAGGRVSPHTIDLLIDAGYDYFGNGLADDIPYYWVTDFATRRSLLAMPYYPHFDDQFFLMFPARDPGSSVRCRFTGTGSGNSTPRARSAAASRSRSIRTWSRGAGGSRCSRTCWRARRARRPRGTRRRSRARAGSVAPIQRARRCDSSRASGRTIPAA
jgi:peptidoglycan/xylan/chitin deacetylase (PgdA/CDA1 family)